MNRIKEITDKKKAAGLDKEAASRFIKNALWVREDTNTKDSMVLHSKPSKGNWVEQFKRLWLTFYSIDLFWMLLVCILTFVILFSLKKILRELFLIISISSSHNVFYCSGVTVIDLEGLLYFYILKSFEFSWSIFRNKIFMKCEHNA